jgi:hypothetical protein
VFAEASNREAPFSSASVNRYGGTSSSGVVYHLSVAVRGVEVETGKIRWSGNAFSPGAVNNPEQGLTILTEHAVFRAICPVEKGYVWVEASAYSKNAGCFKDGKQMKWSETKEEAKSIW